MILGSNFKKRRLCNVHIPLFNQSRHQAINHCKNQGADLETVDVCIRTNDHLVPTKPVDIKSGEFFIGFGFDFHSAAKHLDKIRDDFIFKNFVVLCFQAIENFPTYWDNCLKFGIPAEFAGAKRGITFHNIHFPAGDVLCPTIDKLLHTVCKVYCPSQFLFQIQSGFLCIFTAALVDDHLFRNFVCFIRVFDKIHFQGMAEKGIHRLIDKLVGNCLFRLVLIGSLRRKRGGNQNQAVFDILKGNFSLVFQVFSRLFKVLVNGKHKRSPYRAFRGTTMFQKTGVVIVFQTFFPVGKAKSHIQLDLVFRFVFPIPSFLFIMKCLHRSQGVFPGNFPDIVGNSVLVDKFPCLKPVFRLITEFKHQPSIDNCLAFEHIFIEFHWNRNVRKNFQIRAPTLFCPGLAAFRWFFFQSANIFPLFKMQGIQIPVPADLHVKILGSVLSCTGAQAIESKGIFISFPFVGIILSACIQLTENKLPVVPLFAFIKVHRNPAPKVLYFHRMIPVSCNDNTVTCSLSRLVNGVRQNFKDRVFTSLNPIGSKNNRRTPAYALFIPKHLDTVIIVFFFHTFVRRFFL